MVVQLNNEWDEILKDEFTSEYYLNLRHFLANEYRTKTIYPNMNNIFNGLKLTSYNDAKVVILGQDPYHGPGQAQGLAFSVPKGMQLPPSLQNIYKEQMADLGIVQPHNNGELISWAKQGVLLLNAVLTVEAGKPNSHKGVGWEIFTDNVIKKLNEREKPLVFLLWGANAGAKTSLITNKQHLILKAAHPSPLSAYRGFFGCKHFSKANEFLVANGMEPIDWQIK